MPAGVAPGTAPASRLSGELCLPFSFNVYTGPFLFPGSFNFPSSLLFPLAQQGICIIRCIIISRNFLISLQDLRTCGGCFLSPRNNGGPRPAVGAASLPLGSGSSCLTTSTAASQASGVIKLSLGRCPGRGLLPGGARPWRATTRPTRPRPRGCRKSVRGSAKNKSPAGQSVFQQPGPWRAKPPAPAPAPSQGLLDSAVGPRPRSRARLAAPHTPQLQASAGSARAKALPPSLPRRQKINGVCSCTRAGGQSPEGPPPPRAPRQRPPRFTSSPGQALTADGASGDWLLTSGRRLGGQARHTGTAPQRPGSSHRDDDDSEAGLLTSGGRLRGQAPHTGWGRRLREQPPHTGTAPRRTGSSPGDGDGASGDRLLTRDGASEAGPQCLLTTPVTPTRTPAAERLPRGSLRVPTVESPRTRPRAAPGRGDPSGPRVKAARAWAAGA
ncbi:uncharacterized protein LOC144299450 [Canis aureus]